MTWLPLLALLTVSCLVLYRVWVRWADEGHDYTQIEHRAHGLRVLEKMHDESVRNTNHEGSDQP